MAKAPRPGKAKGDEKPQFMRLRLKDETLEVSLAVSLQEAFVIRNATGGLSMESLMASFGMDSFAVLWFMARRQNGEPRLAWATFVSDWPTDLGEDDIDIDVVDLDAEPPGEDSPLDDAPG